MQVASEPLAQLLNSVFGHLEVRTDAPDCLLQIIEFGEMVFVFENQVTVICCSPTEVVPLVKAFLTERIFLQNSTGVAFHAATLVRGNGALLISGPPGAGKTTLTTRLLQEDFEYAGDDVALIGNDGEVGGYHLHSR